MRTITVMRDTTRAKEGVCTHKREFCVQRKCCGFRVPYTLTAHVGAPRDDPSSHTSTLLLRPQRSSGVISHRSIMRRKIRLLHVWRRRAERLTVANKATYDISRTKNKSTEFLPQMCERRDNTGDEGATFQQNKKIKRSGPLSAPKDASSLV
jgi:hypothetical protein